MTPEQAAEAWFQAMVEREYPWAAFDEDGDLADIIEFSQIDMVASYIAGAAEAREKALREAAGVCDNFGVTRHSMGPAGVTRRWISEAIFALITPTDKTHPRIQSAAECSTPSASPAGG